MSEHERIAPSSLDLTVACNASVQMQESVAQLPSTDEEAEGTAAHWVARRHAAGFAHELPVGAKFISEGKEWTVDIDMYSSAQLYMRTLGAPDPEIHIEEKIRIERVHEQCGGTPDAWRYFSDARQAYTVCPDGLPHDAFTAGQLRLVRVGDFKYGHRFVEVFENFQLGAGYATGVIDRLKLKDIDPNLYVELILVQPRSYHPDGPVRIWRVRASALRAIVNQASMAAEAALLPNPIARTGRHCLDCRARHVCRALQINTARIIDYSHTSERTELDAMTLGQELLIVSDALKLLEARKTGLMAQGEAMLRAGNAVPFYHMEPGKTTLQYFENVNAEELIGLGSLIGIDLNRELKLKDRIVTPTQAVQLGVDPEVMKAYAHRPRGKLVFSRDNSIAARKVFLK